MTLLRLLDVPYLEGDGGPVQLPPRRPNLLLFRLAAEGSWVSREVLADQFWPEEREGDARHNLRLLLSRARKLPWSGALECEATRVRFRIDTDLERFRAALAVRDWAEALRWYRKPLLSGVDTGNLAALDAWVTAERQVVQDGWRAALRSLAAQQFAAGRFREAAGLLLGLWRVDPLAEEALQEYMRVASAAGERGAALREYAAFEQLLAAELGMEPAPATQSLAASLRSVEAPADEFPSSPAILGRGQDVETLRAMLRRGMRLVTLRGPGGIGKTALAQHILRDLAGQYHHAAFVDLSELRDAGLLLATIAAALPVQARHPDALRSLAEFARGKKLLLVLDNFEQLLPAAGQVVRLLREVPALQLLVTSRSSLQLQDEQQYPLEPLALPASAGRAEDSPAVQLFVQRARAGLPAFSLDDTNRDHVTRLCQQLEGVPLAIELAAACLRRFALPDLLSRIEHPLGVLRAAFRDRPERLRSLRAAVEWSYDLLGGQDRQVFECCAVFEGSFTPEALCAVWGSEEVLDHLEALQEQSFLQRAPGGTTRWRMLQPLRELALEHLGRNPLAARWRERHARHYLGMLEAFEARFLGTSTDDRDAVLPEYPNVRAGLNWSVEHARPDLAYRYLSPIRLLWMPLQLYAAEAPLVERVLALPAPPDARLRVIALELRAGCLYASGQLGALEECLHEILSLCRAFGNEESAAWARLGLAELKYESDEGGEAWRLLQEILRADGERDGAATTGKKQRLLHASALRAAAACLLELGRRELALDHAERAQREFAAAGNEVFEISSRVTLGIVLIHLGRSREAADLLLAALRDGFHKGFWMIVPEAFLGLSLLAASAGDWQSVAWFGALSDGTGGPVSRGYLARERNRGLERARELLGEEAFSQARRAANALSAAEAVGQAQQRVRGMLPVEAGVGPVDSV